MDLYGLTLEDIDPNDFCVNLVTSFYISQNEDRNREIELCLLNNAKNKFIKKIYLLNDRIYELKFIPEEFIAKIVQIEVDEDNKNRLGFDCAISFTNKSLIGEICIIANSDIYYDKTLLLLKISNLDKTVFALSRYDHNTKKLNDYPAGCHDSWVYKSPVAIDIEKCNFKFGTWGCDHVINYLFAEDNNLLNPSFEIKSFHVHDSNYRTYQQISVEGKYLYVDISYLNIEHYFLKSIDRFIDEDGYVVATCMNGGYFEYVYNYILHLKKINITWKLLVICMDKKAHELCKLNNIDHVVYNICKIDTFTRFDTSDFNNVVMSKFDCITILLKNQNIKKLLFTDTDMAVYRDFVPYLKSLDDEDIYFQSDCHIPNINIFDSNKCSGFMFMKNNAQIRDLFMPTKLIDQDKLEPADQPYINYKINLCKVKFNQLDRSLFPNGVFYNELPENPFIFHYNYMKGDTKKKSMIVKNDWLLVDYNKLETPQINITPTQINITPTQINITPTQKYSVPKLSQTNTKPIPTKTYNIPTPSQTYNLPKLTHTYIAPTPAQIYIPAKLIQNYTPPKLTQTYVAPVVKMNPVALTFSRKKYIE